MLLRLVVLRLKVLDNHLDHLLLHDIMSHSITEAHVLYFYHPDPNDLGKDIVGHDCVLKDVH